MTYALGNGNCDTARSGRLGQWDGRSEGEEWKNGEDKRVREVRVRLRNVLAGCKKSEEDYRPLEEMGDALEAFKPVRAPSQRVKNLNTDENEL
jgi:hypothetical protein